MSDTNAAIVTCDEASEAFALDELRPLFHVLPPVKWLNPGIALLETGMEFGTFAADVDRPAPVFIRHIAPVQRRFALCGADADLETISNEVRSIAVRIAPERSFAVQTRILGEGKLPYRRVTVNETLSDLLHEITGAELDTRTPEQIISVLCIPDQAYMGMSQGDQNRSLWPGGAHRFKREDAQISRAEFKLLEAFSVFRLTLPTQGSALDMGAAPGGWTRVLRSRGLNVIAVDPADLDVRLTPNSWVTHIRETVQNYLPSAPSFDVIVNDMRMDALESAKLMVRARSHLRANGLAVLTLKLPEEAKAARRNPQVVGEALELLSTHYQLVGARQLYHNRSEVTVALRAE